MKKIVFFILLSLVFSSTAFSAGQYKFTYFSGAKIENILLTLDDDHDGSLNDQTWWLNIYDLPTLSANAKSIISADDYAAMRTLLSLDKTTAADDSGAYLIGVFDEFNFSVSTTVQDVLDDLDAAISALDTDYDGDVDSVDSTLWATKLSVADIDNEPVDSETAAPISSGWAFTLVNTDLPTTYEPIISVPATYVQTAGARMDSEYTIDTLTIDTNPEQITTTAGIWDEELRVSGAADGYEIELLETNAFDGKILRISNVDDADIYHIDDVAGNVQNPNDKTVYIAPGEYVEYEYVTDRWRYVGGGSYDLVIAHRDFGSVLTVDGTYSGNTITMTVDSGQSNTLFGQAYHIDTDGELIEADADAITTAPAFCLAATAGTGSISCLFDGQICETDWNWTIGGVIYLGTDPATTTGLTQTAPSGAGDQVQVIGVALSADTIKVNMGGYRLVEVPTP